MKSREEMFLHHIVDAIGKTDGYLDGVSYDQFLNNTMIQDAVIRQIEIIGEAVKQISSETRALQPHIPWREIGRMRDKLIHHYFAVDLEFVWQTTQEDTQILKRAVLEILHIMANDNESL